VSGLLVPSVRLPATQGPHGRGRRGPHAGFFTHLLEKGALRSADPERGRFRSFLLASLQHYVSNELARARAAKRGGSAVVLPLDDAEGRYRREPPDDRTPERLLDRRWALTVLDRVAATLRDEFRRRGKEAVFDGLKEHLAGDAEGPAC
jgi:hypothetical protein